MLQVTHYFVDTIPVLIDINKSQWSAMAWDELAQRATVKIVKPFHSDNPDVRERGAELIKWREELDYSFRVKFFPITWNLGGAAASLARGLGRTSDDKEIYNKLFTARGIALETLATFWCKVYGDNGLMKPYRSITVDKTFAYFNVPEEDNAKYGRCMQYGQLWKKMTSVELPATGFKTPEIFTPVGTVR